MSAFSAQDESEYHRILLEKYSSIPGFQYEDGYTIEATDLANRGVKIEMSHRHDMDGAIILPPEKVSECGRWMLKTLGQDQHGLPNELTDVLRRISRQTGQSAVLQRGDKQRIREALRILNQ